MFFCVYNLCQNYSITRKPCVPSVLDVCQVVRAAGIFGFVGEFIVTYLFHFTANMVSYRWPHSHILMMGEGGARSPSDLAKSYFLGSVKDARIFLGHKKNRGIFWL